MSCIMDGYRCRASRNLSGSWSGPRLTATPSPTLVLSRKLHLKRCACLILNLLCVELPVFGSYSDTMSCSNTTALCWTLSQRSRGWADWGWADWGQCGAQGLPHGHKAAFV